MRTSIALGIATIIIAASSVAGAATVSLTIVNGNFETDAHTTAGATGWTIATDHFWTSDGSIGGALDPDSGANGTDKFLSPNRTVGGAGSNPVSSFASQSIDISSYASDIDGGAVTLDLGFYYSNGKNLDELTVVEVEFFDAGAGSLGSSTSGDLPQTAEGGWSAGSITESPVAVPVNTRSFTVTLNQRRLGGSGTNAGIDEVTAALFTTESSTIELSNFTYDPSDGSAEVGIHGIPNTSYKLVEADDLDFSTPDQDPIPLTAASIGTLDGSEVTTDSNGDATVQFNLGNLKNKTFLRAETSP